MLAACVRAACRLTCADLAREMLRFEKARFASWCGGVDSAVTAGLQQPLLCRQAAAAADSQEGSGSPSQAPAAAARSGTLDGSGGRVGVNFPPALLRLMREAKYLDQLGFGVPQLAVNLALQEGQLRWARARRAAGSGGRAPHWTAALHCSVPPTVLHPLLLPPTCREHFQELGAMLERHRAAAAALPSAERALLGEQLAGLEAALEPGLARLTWTSLTISDFVAAANKVRSPGCSAAMGSTGLLPGGRRQQKPWTVHRPSGKPLPRCHAPCLTTTCLQAVDQFNALVAQVQKNTSMIEKTLYHISRARLVPPFVDAPRTAGAAVAVPTAVPAAVPAAGGASSGSKVAEGPQQGQAATADAAAPATEPGAAAESTGTAEGGATGAAGPAAGGDAGPAGAVGLAEAGGVDVPDLQEFYEDWEQHRQQVRPGRLRCCLLGPSDLALQAHHSHQGI